MAPKAPVKDEDLLALVPPPPRDASERERMIAGIRYLRARATQLGAPPSAVDLGKRMQVIQHAGEAILALPAPFLEIYSGIGRHLLDEAQKLTWRIERMGRSVGRPTELGKLELILECARYLDDLDRMPASPGALGHQVIAGPKHRPGKGLIVFAKSIWEAEGLLLTSLKNWQSLVAKHWASLFTVDADSSPGPVDWEVNLRNLGH